MQTQATLVGISDKEKEITERRVENVVFSETCRLLHKLALCLRNCAVCRIASSIAETHPQLQRRL